MAADAAWKPNGGGARLVARLVLWTVILCAIACFLIITFMRPTTWYSTDPDFTNIRNNMTLAFPGDVPVLTAVTTKPDGTTAVTNVGRDTPLWAGSVAFPVTLQWGSVMMCALAVAGLQALTYWPAVSGSPRTGVLPAKPNTGLMAAWRLVRRVGATQLPPYRLWNWWCGGLSVFDSLMVMAWLGLAIVYLYYNITRKFTNTGISLTPPPPGPSPPPPYPIDPAYLANLTANATANGTGNSTGGGKSSSSSASSGKAAKVVDLLSPLFMATRLENSAKSFGETLRGMLILMFIPISRSNFLKHITGSDFPTIIKYHRWMSWGTLLIVFMHGALYMIKWGANGSFETELSWDSEKGKRSICGLIAAIFGAIIAFTATTWFRSTYWHVFYRVHLFSAATFVIFALMHYKALYGWMMPGLVMYAIDRAGFRLWQLMRNWTRVGPNDVALDGNMMTIRLSWSPTEGRAIAPGQTVYVRCPAASVFESHPVSVAEVVHSEDGAAHAVLHLAASGPWTRAVCAKLAQSETLSMQVEGPYTTQLDHYTPSSSYVIMIAGGMGITPLLALLRHYLHLLSSPEGASAATQVPRVHLVWSTRSLAQLRLLGQDLLQACCRAAAGDKDAWLSANLHYTGFEQENASQSVQVSLAHGKLDSQGSNEQGSEHNSSDNDLPVATAKTTVSHGGNAMPLRAHPTVNPLVYGLCTLLGFFGAWAGVLTAAYYDAYYARTTALGANYLSVGILQFTCILFGAAIPTLAVLAINDLYMRRRSSSHELESQHSNRSSVELDAAAAKAAGSGQGSGSGSSLGVLSSIATTLQVLPGYVLAPLRSSNGASKVLARGRPDVPALLARLVEEHGGGAEGLAEVDVLVAGQDGLVDDVTRACAEHNMRRAAGVPALRCKRVAFHH